MRGGTTRCRPWPWRYSLGASTVGTNWWSWWSTRLWSCGLGWDITTAADSTTVQVQTALCGSPSAWGQGIGTWTHTTRTRRHSGRTWGKSSTRRRRQGWGRWGVRISPSLQSIDQRTVAWLLVVDGGVVVVIAANRRSYFLLAAGRGGRTVALTPNPPISHPIAGPQRHLPPRQWSRRGSSVSDWPKWRTSLLGGVLAPLQFGQSEEMNWTNGYELDDGHQMCRNVRFMEQINKCNVLFRGGGNKTWCLFYHQKICRCARGQGSCPFLFILLWTHMGPQHV